MFRIAKLLFSICLLLLAPTSAIAQPVWQSYSSDEIRKGAAFCPVNDAQTGGFFCFALSCPKEGTRNWTVSYAGGARPEGEVTAVVTVNGTPAPPITLSLTARTDYVELTAPWEDDRDSILAHQMSSGGSAFLQLSAANWQATFALPLETAGAPLEEVMRDCPAAGASPITDPSAKAKSVATQFCADMGGTLEIGEGFLHETDLNGDGRNDLVVNWGALSCTSGSFAPYCGSAGCVHGLFIALEQAGYKELLETNIRGFRAQTMPVIELHLHGSACGGVGADRCVKYFTLNGALELDELD